MILIADSGSTKTEWAIVKGDELIQKLKTGGINPFYQTELEIASLIKNKLLPQLNVSPLFDKIYFYGAGCVFKKNIDIVKDGLNAQLKTKSLKIWSDIWASARACLGQNPGIACILGTGSNSCYYNGYEILHHVSPLGYILGDEGSGAVLGKNLLGDLLKNQLSKKLTDKFYEKYPITQQQIQEHVYKKPFPNRYMAQFCVFLYENIDHEEIEKMVYNEFERFFQRNIKQYKYNVTQIGFVGKVAYYFEKILRQISLENNLKKIKVLKEPLEELVKFHIRFPES